MSFSTLLFTQKGQALQAKALAGANLNFTRIAMGSGELGGQSQVALTALIQQQVTLAITKISRDLNYATVKGTFNNADISTGFYWREIGIFAQDPDLGEILYCYANAGALAEYIPPQTSEIIEKVVSLSIIVGDASNVTASINESLTFVTTQEFTAINVKVDNVAKFETAGGTGTAITLTGLDILTDGVSKTFIVSLANAGAASTINTKPLYKPGTTEAPTLVTGKAYTVWYDVTGDCFFLKASAEGTATPAQVLAGVPFSNENDTGLLGEMPNNGAIIITPGTVNQAIALGYHDGQGYVAGDADLISANIKAGANIFGVSGNTNVVDTSAGDAVAASILSGKKAYVDGALVTGNMPNHTGEGNYENPWANGDANTQVSVLVSAGFYPGGQYNIGVTEPNLISANILSGKSIFNVAGSVIAGKRFASGIATTSAATVSFQNTNGSTNSAYYLEVTGLSFTPSLIFIFNLFGGIVYITVYRYDVNQPYPKTVMLFCYNPTDSVINAGNTAWKADVTNAYVNMGFKIPASGSGQSKYWYAAE